MSDKNDVAIRVSHVSKAFKLPHEKQSSIKGMFVSMFRGKRTYERQQVLKDVSFEIKKGEFFGIVGRNGSGKSTLLKMLSGIYSSDEGNIAINGKLVPFIELGVGFNPDLTGRENIFLNGALLGFRRSEMAAMYEEIVEFAELEKFMDQKLKNYSSGMQVRLAFSIAIRARADVLVLDEVLAVGDEAFQRKCDDFFASIKKDKTKTVVLVTHSMDNVKKYCNRAILLKEGQILLEGSPDDIANLYTEENATNNSANNKKKDKFSIGLSEEVPLLKIFPETKRVVTSQDLFRFYIEYDYKGNEDIFLAFSIVDIKRGGVTYDSGTIQVKRGKENIGFQVPLTIFNSSDFKIIATLKAGNEARKARMIGFTNDSNSLIFLLRNAQEKTNYPLLNREVFKVERIDSSGRQKH